MRTAYFDCIGGISGDMALGAVLDAGAEVDTLLDGLRTLALPPWELEITRTSKSGIAATSVEVVVRGVRAGGAPLLREPPADAPLETSHAAHGHSHSYQHGHGHSHKGEGTGAGPARRRGGGVSGREGEREKSGTRTFDEVAALIHASRLPDPVKAKSEAVYRRLAAAEAAVHGTPLEQVHFHEVGAVDSIIDVVGAVYGLQLLGVERVVCSPLPTGKGFVRCAHGLMPVPPPATMELLKGCPLRPVEVEAELVTPTGAALASALAAEFGLLPGFVVREVGYGAGKKDFPFPNLLRIVIGEDEPVPSEAREVLLIEANIDDQSPQLYENVMTALFTAGALDVWLTPIQMKKNRPAQTLSALCRTTDLDALTRVVFRETTTLGVRYSRWIRSCLQREWVEVETPYGAVRVKVGRQDGQLCTAAPEFEDCRLRAAGAGVPVKFVHAAAVAAAWQKLSEEAAPRRGARKEEDRTDPQIAQLEQIEQG